MKVNASRNHIALFLIVITSILSCDVQDHSVLNETNIYEKGLLLTTRISSFDEFEKNVSIEYDTVDQSWVKLSQQFKTQVITSDLQRGLKESDILRVRDAGIWSKVGLIFKSPYFVANRHDLLRVWVLSRRRDLDFGGGDVAFYDIAEAMQNNIDEISRLSVEPKDFSEKGFLNTFNHSNSQAFMTMLYSEKLADFIADVHERNKLPELITGEFTNSQLENIYDGPVDNYVDLINNEWGQELGKYLKKKLKIKTDTYWTPALMASVLNELQIYYSWVFNIGFEQFKSNDHIVVQFAYKINKVNESIAGLR